MMRPTDMLWWKTGLHLCYMPYVWHVRRPVSCLWADHPIMKSSKYSLGSQNFTYFNFSSSMIWCGYICRLLIDGQSRTRNRDIYSQARIGFLGTENRICVSLSRAKHALYCIGNMDVYMALSLIDLYYFIDKLRKLNFRLLLVIVVCGSKSTRIWRKQTVSMIRWHCNVRIILKHLP